MIQIPPPVALSIAGSDSSAGAGIQADLKTFGAHRVHGLTALTCVVSETANVVEEVLPLPPSFVAGQVALLLRSFPVAAVKTGMLYSSAHMEAVLDVLEGSEAALVVDPVMVASTGAPLIAADAVACYRGRVLPRATVITPNLDEASALLGGAEITRGNLAEAAHELAGLFQTAVLLKGGHLRDGLATDLLVDADGSVAIFDAPYIEGVTTHGTGCTYSAAITARLACGDNLRQAVAGAKAFITRAIAGAWSWTTPAGRIDALNQIAAADD